MRVLALLSLLQLKNGLRTSLTDPKKLIPLLMVAGAVAWQLIVMVLVTTTRAPAPPGAARWLMGHEATALSFVFLLLSLLVIGILDYTFQEGFLTFSLAEVDYLFPAPIHRKAVLAYRLALKTLAAFGQGLFICVFLVWWPLRSLVPQRADAGTFLGLMLALLFCLGAYTNLALALKLIVGFGRRSWGSRILGAVAVGALAAIGVIWWRGGVDAVTAVTQSWVLNVLFYPCRLAAEALLAPLLGLSLPGPLLQLLLIYALSLGFLFTRREHFYEQSLEGSQRAARLLQATREGNFAALFQIQREVRPRRGKERPFTLPVWGRGAGALLWANLCAAAKRPTVNFLGPLLGGVLLAGISTRYLGPAASFATAWFTLYFLFLLSLSSTATYRQAVQRHPLVRPLPLRPWQAVLADVLPRAGISALPAIGAGVTLSLGGAPHSGVIGPLILICVPAALLPFDVSQYVVALWYPNAQDKLQQMIAAFVGLTIFGLLFALLGGALALGIGLALLLKVPLALAALVLVPVAAGLGALMLFLAGRVYARWEPAG